MYFQSIQNYHGAYLHGYRKIILVLPFPGNKHSSGRLKFGG